MPQPQTVIGEAAMPDVMHDPTAIVLARLEVKLDNALDRLGGHSERLALIEQELAAHATEIAVLQSASLPSRVAAVERRVWLIAGAAAGFGGVGGGVVSRLLGV